MPSVGWSYLTELLCYCAASRSAALAEVLDTVWHDRLPRLLYTNWAEHKLLEVTCHRLFG